MRWRRGAGLSLAVVGRARASWWGKFVIATRELSQENAAERMHRKLQYGSMGSQLPAIAVSVNGNKANSLQQQSGSVFKWVTEPADQREGSVVFLFCRLPRPSPSKICFAHHF